MWSFLDGYISLESAASRSVAGIFTLCIFTHLATIRVPDSAHFMKILCARSLKNDVSGRPL